jgi:preprotein translocase subunit SecE
MNRQMKRQQDRAERQQKRTGVERPATPAAGARAAAAREKRKRTSARQFLKEVRQELKKVDWPTREELVSYTVVVLVTVVVMTSLVFGLDYIFTKIIFNVLN